MPTPLSDKHFEPIEEAVRAYPEGATAKQVAQALIPPVPLRTIQYRLNRLVRDGRLAREGSRRSTKYHIGRGPQPGASVADHNEIPLSRAGAQIRRHLRRPPAARAPTGYRREFLDSYQPNVSSYLSPGERARLREVGTPTGGERPAGTYAKQILNRLLIDLSWNSSRLEGNTYSLLDTKRLIDFGQQAEGKNRLEAQMILNHKDAIEFLVAAAGEIGFNRYTILNLHALLANNLLGDPAAAGRLRNIPIGIERSTFLPLEVPQLIDECFNEILASATAIDDPFEQAFFAMVQLPYLQPFDDVNKRVSRLAANIPLIKGNLVPLSFTDVPRSTYTDAVLGVYELNRIDLLRDVFVWAYERSVARHAAVRQSLGDPDPFKLRYRANLRDVVGDVVRRRLDRQSAVSWIAARAEETTDPADRDRFREIAEDELLALHEGNFARYRIAPSEFQDWQRVWNAAPV